jgi:uncharacterized protein
VISESIGRTDTVEQNKKIVRALLEAIGAGDVDAVDQLLTPDATWELACAEPASFPSAGVHEKAAFLGSVRGMGGLFPDGIRYEVTGMTTEENRVAVEAEGHGSSHGLPFRNRYHFFFLLRDGKIAAAREYMDFAYAVAFHARLMESLRPTDSGA